MELPCVWDAPRPYVHPLTTPAGAVLSVEAPADHPWHHALWFTIKFVNGENFWEEYGEFGTLRTTGASTTDGDGRDRRRIDWVAPDGETRRAHRDPHAAHRRRSTTTRTRSTGPRSCRRRRRPCSTARRSRPGAATAGSRCAARPTGTTPCCASPTAPTTTARSASRRAWFALDGTAHDGVDGPAPAGVVLLDHPDNPRFPTPWYAATVPTPTARAGRTS